MIQINHLHHTLVIGCLLSLASCSTADSPKEIEIQDGDFIQFRTILSEAPDTRGFAFEQKSFESFFVSAIHGNTSADTSDDAYYFKDIKFSRASEYGSTYLSENKYDWPDSNLDFFAYYPKDENYIFEKSSSGENTVYKIKDFSIPGNIAAHIDFVTSYAHSESSNVPKKSLPLQFFHQLSQIEIEGIYNPGADIPYRYSVEVAGVRIGHMPLKGTFTFNNTNTPYSSTDNDGKWDLGEDPYGIVEYQYQEWEKILKLEQSEKPRSLMGCGGNAMVIPAELTKWDVKDNPSNTNEGDLKEGMYLSVLIRVTIEDDGKTVQVYPKTEGDQSAIVEIPVDESGNTVSKSSDNIKQFGWAAVPVYANLEAGKKYKYTLNYSKGVGLHDPEDPKPGTPIGGFNPQNVMVTVTVQPWKDATAEYDPIVTVPYE